MTLSFPQINFPLLSKKKAQAAQAIKPISLSLFILGFLITWRAQLAATLKGVLEIKEIQQLETTRWIAKALAHNGHVREFYISLVMADTLNYDLETFTGKTMEETTEILNNIHFQIEEGSRTSKASSNKVLNDNALNTLNISSHRYALITKHIGTYQARSIFNPFEIVKGAPPSAISLDILGKTLVSLHATFDIPICQEYSDLLLEAAEDPNVAGSPHAYALGKICKDHVFPNHSLTLTFNDAVNLGSQDNKLPLEEPFPIERPLPAKIQSAPVLNLELLENKALSFALETQKSLIKDSSTIQKKVKEKKKEKGTRTTKQKGKVKAETENSNESPAQSDTEAL